MLQATVCFCTLALFNHVFGLVCRQLGIQNTVRIGTGPVVYLALQLGL